MILFISIIFVLVLGLFFYTLPQLFLFTSALTEWCQSLFFRCLEYLLILKVFFLWLGLAALSLCFGYALSKALFALFRTNREIKAFPTERHEDIIIIKDEKLKVAFTHGLFNPQIYMSKGLINSLDSSELKAVYLHELHHKKNKDPLRFFLLSVLRDTFFYIPISRFVEKIIRSRTETKADDTVVAEMKEPLSLATALLKVSGFNRDMRFQLASIRGYGSLEARVKRLVEGREENIKPPSAKVIMASILMAAFLALSLSMPIFASLPNVGSCNMDHCSVHMNKLGKDCQNHCEASRHEH